MNSNFVHMCTDICGIYSCIKFPGYYHDIVFDTNYVYVRNGDNSQQMNNKTDVVVLCDWSQCIHNHGHISLKSEI